MVLLKCPRCDRTIVVDNFNTDFVHECNSGNNTLDQEDVLNVGDWSDYTGSGTSTQTPPNYAGVVNTLFGTDAAIEGGSNEELTVRGNRKSTHRTRQHSEYINLNK